MSKLNYKETFDGWSFDNSFIRELPADPIAENSRRQVENSCYSFVHPQKVKAPQLVAYSPELVQKLRLHDEISTKRFVEVLAGNQLVEGMNPYAMCYGGHQFGNWAGQLGDGRAINIAEIITSEGQRLTLQLKGAGPTPYSRTADGLAVLRSSVREFLCSEAMYHLGIPTTRALSLVLTGELVERDMLYNGNPRDEPGAIVCRVAPSFLRFGNFELLASRQNLTLLQRLIDYSIETEFPHLGKPCYDTYVKWFSQICSSTAEMIVHWMRVGFVHGVMNTDNMSILGLTIDYGPYGWLEGFDTKWTPNTTDAQGKRYCFGNQPHIAQWNLVQLANAIFPIVKQVEPLQMGLATYSQTFEEGWNNMVAQKIGLQKYRASEDDALFKELFDILAAVETDMTLFFRGLAKVSIEDVQSDLGETSKPLVEAYYNEEGVTGSHKKRTIEWLRKYGRRLEDQSEDREKRIQRMNSVNPKYVLRNYLAQQAIERAEEGDFEEVWKLLNLLKRPYDEQPENQVYAKKRPEWARNKPGCSMLSCSS